MRKFMCLVLAIGLMSCGQSNNSESSKSELTEKALTINGENLVVMRESIDAIKESLDSIQRVEFTNAWTEVASEFGMMGAMFLPEKEKEIAFDNFLKKIDGKTAEDILNQAAKINNE